jgi:hypothetical protein
MNIFSLLHVNLNTYLVYAHCLHPVSLRMFYGSAQLYF